MLFFLHTGKTCRKDREIVSEQAEVQQISTGVKPQYHAIDLMKFIGSIMVFTMHMNAFGDVEQFGIVFEVLTRWCVPFFFITSSYFLFSKSVEGNIKESTLKNYLKRIGCLYGVYFIFNLPSIAFYHLISQGIRDIRTWLLFVKDGIISSTFVGSWYLLSSMLSAVIIYFLSKKLKTKPILIITGVIQVICVMCSVYRGLLPYPMIKVLVEIVELPLNCLGGVFYFAIGKFIYEERNNLLKIPSSLIAVVSVVSYGLYFAEVYIAKYFGYFATTDQAFFLMPASTGLVLLLLRSTVTFDKHILFRKLSTIIYCCQGNVLFCGIVIKHLFECGCFVRYLFGVVIIIICSVAILLIQKSGKFKWAGYMT